MAPPFPHRNAITLAGAAIVLSGTIAAAQTGSVEVLYAGSLVTAIERDIRPAFEHLGFTLNGEARGSLAAITMIKDGLRHPDVLISADPVLLERLRGPANGDLITWYATFATSRLVIGYAPSSPYASAFADVAQGKRKLIDVLLTPGLRLGRTDPTLDPKGYRTIIAARLLEHSSGVAGFAQQLLGPDENDAQIFPEETLLSRLESGDLDAAFLYATESVARHLPAVELPAEANLGDAAQAATYASVSVDVAGTEHRGAPILYALTIPSNATDPLEAAAFIGYLLSPDGRAKLEQDGLHLIAPRISGDASAIPTELRPLL